LSARQQGIFALYKPRSPTQSLSMSVCCPRRFRRASSVRALAVLSAFSSFACSSSSPATSDAMVGGSGGDDDESDASEPRDGGALDAAAAHDAGPTDARKDADSAREPELAFASASGSTWEGTGEWRIELKLAEPAPRALHYELATAGSAQSGGDYKLPSGVQIAAGESSATLTVSIVNDTDKESYERLVLSLKGSSPAVSYSLGIADDDEDRWPTTDTVSEVDAARAFPGANLSGLVYAPARASNPAELWMVRNGGPSQLYRLRQSGGTFSPLSSDSWAAGKTLVFPNGAGAPDTEGLTMADWSSPLIYASSERDGNGPSASAVLVFDTSASGSTLTATRSWDLSSDLSTLMLMPNAGPEALAWVPDSYLTSAGFFDEARNAPYDPAHYPDHAGGLFFVGIEQTGGIYAYALDHSSGTATRVAMIASGQSSVEALEFDRDTNYLWAWCDDTCGNHATVLRVEDNPASSNKGRFGVRRSLNRPSTLPDLNHEGMTIAPSSECSDDKKAVYWVEDGTSDHILRRGSVPCGAFLDME
jgi:hypothetical protein